MRLGLDLRGGTQVVLEAKDPDRGQVDGDTSPPGGAQDVERTLEVLRRRVDQLGVAEPTLQRSGDRRVIVELPGVDDPEEAVEVIGRTAQLTFHPVLGPAGAGAGPAAGAKADELMLPDEDGGRLRLGPAALDLARAALAAAGFPRAVVQRSGDANLTVRTGQVDTGAERRIQAAVAGLGVGQVERLRAELVGPTIGEELRRKALTALGLALAAQLAYLAVRFRWTFGAAAVLAMFHDVAILLGVFAWLGKPLDGVFLAALLTVIGGDTLTDFALALLIGIGVGTWSSMFVATPLLVAFERGRRRPTSAAPARPAARPVAGARSRR